MNAPRFDQVYSGMTELGYKIFDKPYDMNFFGVRSDVLKAGDWDDWIGAFYTNDAGGTNYHVWQGTTDPSAVWLQRGGSPQGTFIICPGQYRGLWALGMHRGKYRAFVQVGMVRGWRDNNKDTILDMGPNQLIVAGHFGINGHKGSGRLDEDSAGCQVVLDQHGNYNFWVALGEKQVATLGLNVFTYSLLLQQQLGK